MTIQRQDCLDGKVSHREYYAQFVNEYVRARAVSSIGMRSLLDSTDKHFNDIPLHRWDSIDASYLGLTEAFKAAGDYVTKAGLVCVFKEAAKQIVEKVKLIGLSE